MARSVLVAWGVALAASVTCVVLSLWDFVLAPLAIAIKYTWWAWRRGPL